MTEAQYQAKLVKKIKELLPGSIVIKNDPRDRQGMPDILILYKHQWAMLEVKLSGDAKVQPNQWYYVELLNDMSFASFINPQNEEDVLSDLQQTFGIVRATRVS